MALDRPIYEISNASEFGAELSFGLLTVVALVYCVWLARRARKVWPVMVWLSGAPMTLWEPMQNIVTHCVYPEIGQHEAFAIFGLAMPVYLVFVYMCYFGLAVPWIMLRIERGITVRQLATIYAALVVSALAFEPVPVSGFKWWNYYGSNQPLKFFGTPIWWAFVNAMVIVGVAVIFQLLLTHVLRADWQSVVFVPAAFFICAGLHESAGSPAYAAIGSNWRLAVTVPMSLLSCGLAVVYVLLLARLVAVPKPARSHADQAPDRVEALS